MTSDLSPLNSVRLRGRVSAEPRTLELPSGDTIVTFRVVVERSPAARKRSKQTVDTLECVAWTARLRRSAARLGAGDGVEVTGSLRRRFSRGGGALQSFASIEVETLVSLGPVPSSGAAARR